MRKLVAILVIISLPLAALAQINQQGRVSVKQSSELDELIFGKQTAKTKEQKKAEKKAEKEAKRAAKEAEKQRKAASKKGMVVGQQTKTQEPVVIAPTPIVPREAPKIEVPTDRRQTTRTKIIRRRIKRADGSDSTRRVRRTIIYQGTKKVNGFRVQVYSGGNTREDRQNAEQTGHKVKSTFPTQPVYVHFYSPRWMCLVGNFTNKKAASEMLRKVKKAGFPQATVISTRVTVRNAHYMD